MKFFLFALLVSLAGYMVLPESGAHAGSEEPDPLVDTGFEQALGAQLPLNVTLRSEQGDSVDIGNYFKDRPVILVFAYYDCPMLCSLVLADLIRSLSALEFSPGTEFEVVTVSIDPSDTPELATVKKSALLSEYRRPGAEKGWHFLTGEQHAIDQLAGVVGFRYSYLEDQEEYAHPAGLVVLTPSGKISRYFFGLNYSPQDLRLGLVEASANRIGNWVDQAYLLCYEYDPSTGTYGLLISRLLRLAGLVTVAGIGGLVGVLVIKERSHG